jgi:hypothetical protein
VCCAQVLRREGAHSSDARVRSIKPHVACDKAWHMESNRHSGKEKRNEKRVTWDRGFGPLRIVSARTRDRANLSQARSVHVRT